MLVLLDEENPGYIKYMRYFCELLGITYYSDRITNEEVRNRIWNAIEPETQDPHF